MILFARQILNDQSIGVLRILIQSFINEAEANDNHE